MKQTLSEVTFTLTESDFARILSEPGKLELVYTSELGDTVVMPVHEVIGYCGPRWRDE